MTQYDKLLSRFLSLPKDFKIDELNTLMSKLGFRISNRGKTSGSAIAYINEKKHIIRIHRPHPSKIVKLSALKDILNNLKENGYI